MRLGIEPTSTGYRFHVSLVVARGQVVSADHGVPSGTACGSNAAAGSDLVLGAGRERPFTCRWALNDRLQSSLRLRHQICAGHGPALSRI